MNLSLKVTIIYHSRENIICHTQNVIYLLSCKESNVQYVREITFPLQKGINLHRRAKSEYKYIIKHFKNVCVGAYFSI